MALLKNDTLEKKQRSEMFLFSAQNCLGQSLDTIHG